VNETTAVPAPSAELVERDLQAIREQGYVVIERLLTPADIAAIRDELAPHLAAELWGRNDFEGHRTQRVYSLVGKGKVFEDLAEHPRILAICDALLEPNYLLTASQAILIHPGETPQPFHTDDAFYRLARPRPAVSVSTIWAIDPFTGENGATQVVAGSHAWGDEDVFTRVAHIDFSTAPRAARSPKPGQPPPDHWREQIQDVAMPEGSVIVFLGTLVHRGGENTSAGSRLGLSNQYCEPWARQQENFFLSIAPGRVRAMSPRVQQMLGYSIHPPFMGHADGVHPLRYVERSS
jgi:ectoine hydroxylase-related dioxygenase (phytanoyl-CoA dioxygenase family)